MKDQTPHPMSFEASFARLEEILEKMNSGNVPLDESLKLYDEANDLINNCNKQLNEAEKRIETLIKNRNNDLVLGADQQPKTQSFNTTKPQDESFKNFPDQKT